MQPNFNSWSFENINPIFLSKGAHGDGTPEETLTPLVVWGPGIRKPSIENVMMNNPLSKGTRKFLKIRTPKNCCNCPKIWTACIYHTVMCPKDADRMANSVDPDQQSDLSFRSSMIWVYTVCQGLSVQKLRIITVILHSESNLMLSFKNLQRKKTNDFEGIHS